MAKEDELNIKNDDVTIIDSGAAAEPSGSEDTAENPLQSVIDQQNATIETLLKQNETLTKQFNLLLRNGAQINDGASVQQVEDPEPPEHNPLFDQYPNFSDMAKDFGTWDKNKGV